MKVIRNGEIIAESFDTVVIEGNHYFPVGSKKKGYIKPSETETVCHLKGTASYFNLEVNGKENADAAWYYPEPSAMAKGIKGRGITFSEGFYNLFYASFISWPVSMFTGIYGMDVFKQLPLFFHFIADKKILNRESETSFS